jgi:molecular chaperone GrpE
MKKKSKKKHSKAQEEFEDLKNQLARALADYDNLRKRVEKDREHFSKIASLGLIAKLLPIHDMLEDAQKHLKDSGLTIVISEFEQILKEEGVVKISSGKGEKFDENYHEAIEKGGGNQEGKILKTLATGWMFQGGPVIRPAKVKVGGK